MSRSVTWSGFDISLGPCCPYYKGGKVNYNMSFFTEKTPFQKVSKINYDKSFFQSTLVVRREVKSIMTSFFQNTLVVRMGVKSIMPRVFFLE